MISITATAWLLSVLPLCAAQVGGTACRHPSAEGFPMDIHTEDNFHDALNEFDDCSRGCWCWDGCYAGNDEDAQDNKEYFNNYGKAIDKFLVDNVNGKISEGLVFEFDYERTRELAEGWWPVLIRFRNNEYYRESVANFYETKFKGYLHFGNCD